MEGLGLSLEKDSERKYTRILKKLTLDYGIAMIFKNLFFYFYFVFFQISYHEKKYYSSSQEKRNKKQ